MAEEFAIDVQGLRTQFGKQVVHDDLSLQVRKGEVIGIVGGSGTGKSVLLRTIVGLNRPAAGRITVLGKELARLDETERRAMPCRFSAASRFDLPACWLTMIERSLPTLSGGTCS